VNRVTLWLFQPAPAARLHAWRALVGAYATVWLLIRIPAHLDHADQLGSRWDPVGMLGPLDGPLPSALVVVIAIAAPVLAALFAGGWRYRVVAPAFALVLLAVTTLDSSWGQVFHTENLLVLHVVILALAPAAGGPATTRADGRYGWPLRLGALVVVIAYVTAGLAKLRIGGIDWVSGDVLRNLVAHDNMRKAVLGDSFSPIGTRAVGLAWLFTPLALFALAVELGAPLALLGRRWRTTWIVAALAFHAGVLALMAVLFPYQLTGVAFAPFLPLERLAGYLRRMTSAPPSPGSATQPDGTTMVQSGSTRTTGPTTR
jgi:hypothetical protein